MEDPSFNNGCYDTVKHGKTNNGMLTTVALTRSFSSNLYYLRPSVSQEEAGMKDSKRIYLTM